MPEKSNVKQTFSVRLDQSLIQQIRSKAKQDYGDEKLAGLVVEEGMSKYLTAELNGNAISTMLSATEGALYDRLATRIEKEFTHMRERVGSLVAKQSYEAALTSLMMEQLYFRGASKEQYEQLRKEASQRTKTRLEDSGSRKTGTLFEENLRLENENKKLETRIKKIKSQLDQFKDIQQVLEKHKHNFKLSEDLRNQYVDWFNQFYSYALEEQSKGIMKKSLEQIRKEFETKKPKPKGL